MAVAAAARRLEDELCRGNTKGIDPEPCPREGTRLAFYITSLTKPGSGRDAAAQLKVALPLNLFLALQSREWATFYVSLSELLCQSSIYKYFFVLAAELQYQNSSNMKQGGHFR
jgi:hypothetical protein